VVRILSVLSKLMGFSIDSSALRSWVSEFESVLQQQVAKNDELQAFIKQLETAYDQTMTDTDVQQGDEIVEEIQQFLRLRHRPGDTRRPPMRHHKLEAGCIVLSLTGRGRMRGGEAAGRTLAWEEVSVVLLLVGSLPL
jgi:hypothetical protein